MKYYFSSKNIIDNVLLHDQVVKENLFKMYMFNLILLCNLGWKFMNRSVKPLRSSNHAKLPLYVL